jgi:hypothetical protein
MLNPNLKMINAYKNSRLSLPMDEDLDRPISPSPSHGTPKIRPEKRKMTVSVKMLEGQPDRTGKFA